MIIPVVFATDDNYVLPLSVALKSLVDSKNKTDELDIYIFNSSLTQESIDILKSVVGDNAKLSFVCVDEYLKGAKLYATDKVTVATYYRYLAPKILSQYKKILYLDCDILVMQSLSGFYNLNLDGFIIASPQQISDNLEKLDYFNAGIIAINVEEYNKNDICQKCLDYTTEHQNLPYPDETVLNIICKGRVKYIDYKYNFQTWYAMGDALIKITEVRKIKDIVIMHFSDKPWKRPNCIMAEYWWKKVKTLPKDLQNKILDKYQKDFDYSVNQKYYQYYFASPIKKLFIKIKSKFVKK